MPDSFGLEKVCKTKADLVKNLFWEMVKPC